MATTFNPKQAKPKGRPGKSRFRFLLVVFLGAVLLVTLPVLPLRFLGIPGPDLGNLPFDLSSLRALFNGFSGNNEIADQLPTGREAREEVRLLDEAARQLELKVARSPADPSLHNRLGLIYAELGEFSSSTTSLQKAIEVSRHERASIAERVRQASQKGDSKAATEALIESSRTSVELSAAHSSLARVYSAMGKRDLAMQQLEQLDHDIAFNADLTRLKTVAQVPPPAPPHSHRMSPEALRGYARAQALMQSRRLDEAMREFRKVIALDPEMVLPHQQLAMAAAMAGNNYTAVKELEAAARLDPEDAATHSNLGLAYLHQGQHEKAQPQFETAISLDPHNVEAAINLSNIFLNRGENAQAEHVLRTAAAKNPNNAKVHNNLGTINAINKDYKSAIDQFEKAIDISPDMASAHYGLGLAYYNLKEFQPAIRELKKALYLNPQLIDAHSKIEMCCRRAGLAVTSHYRM